MAKPHFDGPDYVPALDHARLTDQHQRIYAVMKGGDWLTLGEIAAATGAPEASVSAQLRHLRKTRFGSFPIERRRRAPRLWEYSMDTKERRSAQLERVRTAISLERWWTLAELAKATGDPEASVSARLRDLRKPEFGGMSIARRRRTPALWEYKMGEGELKDRILDYGRRKAAHNRAEEVLKKEGAGLALELLGEGKTGDKWAGEGSVSVQNKVTETIKKEKLVAAGVDPDVIKEATDTSVSDAFVVVRLAKKKDGDSDDEDE